MAMTLERLMLFDTWAGRKLPALPPSSWPVIDRILACPEPRQALCRSGQWEAAALLEDEPLRAETRRIVRARIAKGWKPIFPGNRYFPEGLVAEGRRCPPLLWLSGSARGVGADGVGIVGSRILTSQEARFAAGAGQIAAAAGCTVFSGGAQGADSFALAGAQNARGPAIAFLPGGERECPGSARVSRVPEAPPFLRPEALARNRWIYASSRFVLIVASRFNEGGSWAGAIAARRDRLSPIIVFMGARPSSGNEALAKMGTPTVSSLSAFRHELPRLLQTPQSLAI
ncbi:MAG TPA: DNA-processing protein DprA [Fimbriimonadales bacterium]|nr:DNA-processing protein DprA [Fimbriimonadales bacterium]